MGDPKDPDYWRERIGADDDRIQTRLMYHIAENTHRIATALEAEDE